MFPISSKKQGIKELLQTYKRPLLYLIVGGINTGVDFASFQLLHFLASFPEAASQGISYTLGVICSFFLNRSLTFRDHVQAQIVRQAGRFVLVNLVTLLTSVLGIHLLVSTGLPAFFAKVTITGVTMVMNYLGYKWFVFKVK